jgi:hypothetical protein
LEYLFSLLYLTIYYKLLDETEKNLRRTWLTNSLKIVQSERLKCNISKRLNPLIRLKLIINIIVKTKKPATIAIAAPARPIDGNKSHNNTRFTNTALATAIDTIPGRFVPSKNEANTLPTHRARIPMAKILIKVTEGRKADENKTITIGLANIARITNTIPTIMLDTRALLATNSFRPV